MAGRAIERRALPLPYLSDTRTARAAGFSSAAIDEIILLEITAAAVAVHEITQRAAPLRHGFKQHFLYGLCQAPAARQGKFAGSQLRANAGAEQGFISVDVSYAYNQVVVHVEGGSFPTVNGSSIGEQPHQLRDHDLIELAGVKMEFYFKT